MFFDKNGISANLSNSKYFHWRKTNAIKTTDKPELWLKNVEKENSRTSETSLQQASKNSIHNGNRTGQSTIVLRRNGSKEIRWDTGTYNGL